MIKRIFHSIFFVAIVVFLACFVLTMAVLGNYFSDMQYDKLKEQAELVSCGVEMGGSDYLNRLRCEEYRITWIAEDGTVLFDNAVDAAAMENHADREEVDAAKKAGVGESERYSSTLATKTINRAIRLEDDSVLRISVVQNTLLSLIYGMIQPILIVFILALVLSLILAHNLSRRIVGPLNSIDLEHPLENKVYDELSPLLSRLEQQHREILYQKDELGRRQDEFDMVTDSMNEGLILLNAKGTVISINMAARQIFGVSRHCIGRDFLTVDRSLSLQNVIQSALCGHHGELVIERNDCEYQIKASAIFQDGSVSGAVLLIFDITGENQAEKQRREFTANVSHELKSPLQTIMGSAELLENGLVKTEDYPRFIGRIHSEAERLMVLIDDIIRLSQLDEGGELPFEDLDLLLLAEETKDALSDKASKMDMTIAVAGKSVIFRGIRSLIGEILYNLCDNALKYNKAYGTVTVIVGEDDGCAVLTVADTGIGISEEHLGRIFERFYRVDKSHSRETGGTGLGLSIVKHAARLHNAVILVQSEVGKGTTFTLRFPFERRTFDS